MARPDYRSSKLEGIHRSPAVPIDRIVVPRRDDEQPSRPSPPPRPLHRTGDGAPVDVTAEVCAALGCR
jgi:hypothetical protein